MAAESATEVEETDTRSSLSRADLSALPKSLNLMPVSFLYFFLGAAFFAGAFFLAIGVLMTSLAFGAGFTSPRNNPRRFNILDITYLLL